MNKNKSFLYPHQWKALDKMFSGCILNGGTGSGKSRTGLYYYFKENGGSMEPEFKMMDCNPKPQDLYIITTAKKRNDMEWEEELAPYGLSTNPERNTMYGNTVVVDSWNNIKKYQDIKDAFFIFDEDKVTGYGAWVKAFLKISKYNKWIILSATPGDKWEDYTAVFIANGFYKNKTEMAREHFVYSRYSNFPKVEGYMNERRLIRLREKILIDMVFDRHTVQNHHDVVLPYDRSKYKEVMRTRWDCYKNEPIEQAASLCYVLRRVVNEDESRAKAILDIYKKHPRLIIFYNFNYERDILLNLDYGEDVAIAEYNGHCHQKIPDTEKWVYIVNYTAGCEGWNSTQTNAIAFYSQTYSYKVLAQSIGRIDRLTTPYTDLHYYHLKSKSQIDLAISRAIKEKRRFNVGQFVLDRNYSKRIKQEPEYKDRFA